VKFASISWDLASLLVNGLLSCNKICNNPVFFQWITKIKIHSSFFFLKLLTKNSRCVLWAGASYRPGNTVILNRHPTVPIGFPFSFFFFVKLFTIMLLIFSSCWNRQQITMVQQCVMFSSYCYTLPTVTYTAHFVLCIVAAKEQRGTNLSSSQEPTIEFLVLRSLYSDSLFPGS
jgi:hypothetical protein